MAFFSNLFKKEIPNVIVENYNQNVLYSPLKGEAILLETVSDPVFAEGNMGQGLAIVPTDGKLYAPVNGTVVSLFPTNHAIGIISETGVEILIHIGIDTVNLKGQGFKTHIKKDDVVKAGQILVEFDVDFIVSSGCEATTMILISNYKGGMDVMQYGKIEVMEQLILFRPES